MLPVSSSFYIFIVRAVERVEVATKHVRVPYRWRVRVTIDSIPGTKARKHKFSFCNLAYGSVGHLQENVVIFFGVCCLLNLNQEDVGSILLL